MNILAISHEYPPIGGGGANACKYLTREFVRLGNHVTLVTSAYQKLPYQETIDGVNIIRVKAMRKQKEKSSFIEMLTYLLSAGMKIDSIVKNGHFDMCLVFFGIPSGPLGIRLKRKYGLPYAVRLGGGDIPGAQKRFKGLYTILAPFVRSIWKNASALIANSEGLQQRAYGFESKYPVQIIENGVDSDFFHCDRQLKKSDDKITILFVSRLIKGKGLQHIIPHMKKIETACGRAVELIIVGDGPYRDELENITKEANADDLVRFEGRKNKEELLAYYEAADFFILPSESEGMPNVVLEAMAMGLPIIMTPCEGSKELIHGNGYIEPIDNFVDRMIYLCKEKEERLILGKKSAELARTEFSWQQKALRYLDFFQKSL